MTRTLRHLGILLAVTAVSALTWLAGEPAGARDRLSLLTAWLCYGFFVPALLIGPSRALRTGRPTLNDLLRRDLGIWAAVTGLAHLFVATAVVMTPEYFRIYINGPAGSPGPGLAGWVGTLSIVAGYLVGPVFLLLLALSSNRALRRLGNHRWKRLQRWAYVAFALTVAHGVVFQVIEGRTGTWLVLLTLMALGVVLLQFAGRRAVITHSD